MSSEFVCDTEGIEVTFHGLNEWYDRVFSKLGWMVLFKMKHFDTVQNENGKKEISLKIKEYIMSVCKLQGALNDKMKKATSDEKKEDLNIMLTDVNILKAHLDSDFASVIDYYKNLHSQETKEREVTQQIGGKRRRGSKKGSKKAKNESFRAFYSQTHHDDFDNAGNPDCRHGRLL